jgi:hypothetical protein
VKLLKRCLDVMSTQVKSTMLHPPVRFFSVAADYRLAESRASTSEAPSMTRPPTARIAYWRNPLRSWVDCAWVEVSRGRFVCPRIKASFKLRRKPITVRFLLGFLPFSETTANYFFMLKHIYCRQREVWQHGAFSAVEL